jgi:hypothetical protein|nr:MAG TPA: hypothetical protein [Caudoviricetes sp.]
MPDFTLYNASAFHDFTPEDVQSEFTEMLGRPQVVMPGDSGDSNYYSREDIFAACLGVSDGKRQAPMLAFGGSACSPRLVFAQLIPVGVSLGATAAHPSHMSYRLRAGGANLGNARHGGVTTGITCSSLYNAEVAMFDLEGTYHIVEYAYVSGGEAASPGWDGYDSPLADGSYVLLEQTGTLY